MSNQPTNDQHLSLFGKIKKWKQWRAFTKHTLNYVDKHMKEQQDITIKAITEEMGKFDLPLTNDKILFDIILDLREKSGNMKALRENYASLKHDMATFFERMDILVR